MLQPLLHSLAYLLASPLPRPATKPGHTGPAAEPERPSHTCRGGVDASDFFGVVTIIFQLAATIMTARCTLRSVPLNKHPRTTIEPAVELLLADMHSTFTEARKSNPQPNALPPDAHSYTFFTRFPIKMDASARVARGTRLSFNGIVTSTRKQA